jgi:DNA-3-methyladenine glycosylase II
MRTRSQSGPCFLRAADCGKSASYATTVCSIAARRRNTIPQWSGSAHDGAESPSAWPAMKSTKSKAARSQSTIESRLTVTDPALGYVIAAVVARIGPQRIAPSRVSAFEALVRAVVYQSVSGKAAASIFTRLKDVVPEPLTPLKVLARRPQSLAQAAGLSNAKARTIRGLAEWFESNAKLASALRTLPDDEIVEVLGVIPGIGAWTVNVFLIFNLGRLDVMPPPTSASGAAFNSRMGCP